MSDTRKNLIPISKLDALGDFYTDSPIMRALASLVGVVPGFSALDDAVVARWERAKAERFKLLLNELTKGEQYLTEELIQQEDFIYAFISIARASVFTRRKEKIRLFAQLLTNACQRNNFGSEEFEENFKVLDDLSLRELNLLLLFKKHEDRLIERVNIEPGDYRKSQYEALMEDAKQELGITPDNLSSTLARLSRTGLYVLEFGFPASNRVLMNGRTTPKLVDFLNWVLERDDNKTGK